MNLSKPWLLAALLLSAPAAAVEITAAARAHWLNTAAVLDASRNDAGLAALLALPDAIEREARLLAAVQALHNTASPSSHLRRAVESLRDYRPQVLAPPPDPDHARGRHALAFDVPAAARALLHEWQLRDDALALANALQSRQPLAKNARTETWQRAAQQLTDPALNALLPDTVHWPAAARAVVAQRRPSAARYRALLNDPAAETGALHWLAQLDQRLPPGEALSVLAAALEQPELASAAALALGRSGHPQAPALLLAKLGDPHVGGSSAQALALAPSDTTLAALAALIRSPHDSPQQRRALLALRWSQHPEAREWLAQFAADTRHPTALRAEVLPWLR